MSNFISINEPIFSKASKRNKRKKELRAIKRAKCDSSLNIDTDIQTNGHINEAKDIFYDPQKVSLTIYSLFRNFILQ
jgi:hypothetical protein